MTMTDSEVSMLGDLERRVDDLEHPPTLHERLRHMAWWVRVEAPLLPPAEQMAEFADAARMLDALAEEVRELENRLARSGIAHEQPKFEIVADVLEP